ncbi:MAG: TonB family protein [Acidobacteriia bacterium]|nr:TonB family protein [Terriglobia bacterium]
MTLRIFIDQRESLRGTLLLSLVLHGALFLAALSYTIVGPHFGGRWGKNWGRGGAVRVSAVASLPGVPLPAPVAATVNTVATQNPGLYQSEKEEKVEPPPQAQAIPKFKESVAPEKAERINRRIQKEPLETPENAIPYGHGGQPSMSYSQFANTAGEGGLDIGDGNFGDRYGWYVAAVRNRISSNWLLSVISPSILTAPRVYVTFDVLRDGTVTNVRITQSSSIPEVDRSALRAVLASNPLGPLPPDYAGNKVSVEFYFDFRRR